MRTTLVGGGCRILGVVIITVVGACTDLSGTATVPVTVTSDSGSTAIPLTLYDGEDRLTRIRLTRESSNDGLLSTRVVWKSSNDSIIAIEAPQDCNAGNGDNSNSQLVCLRANGVGVATIDIHIDQPGFIVRDTSFTIRVTQRWIDVAASAISTCGINVRLRVFCWGDENYIGNGTTDDGSIPNEILAPGLRFDRLFSGPHAYVTCALVARTSVPYCWGDNEYGTGGMGSFVALSVLPTLVGGSLFSSMSLGDSFSCGVARYISDNGVESLATCWGLATDYRMGNRSSDLAYDQPCNEPEAADDACVYVVGFETAVELTATSTAVGEAHGCAVTNVGVWCWGNNAMGQLGVRTDSSLSVAVRANVPGQVDGDTAVVSAGLNHTCYLVGPRGVDSPVYCWGNSVNGQAPVRINGNFVEISSGADFTCGRRASGSVGCWAPGGSPGPIELPDGRTFIRIASGYGHICGISSGDGAMFCWGDNSVGQLGDGSLTRSDYTPVRVAESR